MLESTAHQALGMNQCCPSEMMICHHSGYTDPYYKIRVRTPTFMTKGDLKCCRCRRRRPQRYHKGCRCPRHQPSCLRACLQFAPRSLSAHSRRAVLRYSATQEHPLRKDDNDRARTRFSNKSNEQPSAAAAAAAESEVCITT
jgi:hypothetical protein